jgi:hypothetical protein
LFATPWRRDEWQCWKKVAGKNHRRPKQTDSGKSQTTMACEPVHSKILENCTGTANPKDGIGWDRRARPSRNAEIADKKIMALAPNQCNASPARTFAAGMAAATGSHDGSCTSLPRLPYSIHQNAHGHRHHLAL